MYLRIVLARGRESYLAKSRGGTIRFRGGAFTAARELQMGTLPLEITAAALLVAAVVLLRKPLRAWRETREAQRARRDFRRQREVLEARFFDLAAASGKPRGLRWVECDWLDTVTFARDRRTGLLAAFVAVNIRFEAVEGGDLEDVAAVANILDASY